MPIVPSKSACCYVNPHFSRGSLISAFQSFACWVKLVALSASKPAPPSGQSATGGVIYHNIDVAWLSILRVFYFFSQRSNLPEELVSQRYQFLRSGNKRPAHYLIDSGRTAIL